MKLFANNKVRDEEKINLIACFALVVVISSSMRLRFKGFKCFSITTYALGNRSLYITC
jgi:hypothetical protein